MPVQPKNYSIKKNGIQIWIKHTMPNILIMSDIKNQSFWNSLKKLVKSEKELWA